MEAIVTKRKNYGSQKEILPNLTHQNKDWKEQIYQYELRIARDEAFRQMEDIEEKLYHENSISWHIAGLQERTIKTRFGEVTIQRKIYRDDQGNYHLLMDEYLN